MDKLFSRKRSMSIAARHKEQSDRAKAGEASSSTSSRPLEPATLKKATTTGGMGSKKSGKRKEALDQAFGLKGGPKSAPLADTRRHLVDDKAPSLTLDIRSSLMLPGLSQRFSVLLPKLSTAPETSLRSMLASQRARQDGPSLTLEEEELLFAEMRDSTPYSPPLDNWDGSAPSTAESWRGHSTDYLSRNGLPVSTSSLSILSQSSDGTARERPQVNGSPSSSFLASPPPTSNSFSSFQTFGNQHQDSPRMKTKSYGFSSRSQMRDDTYLRKISGKNLAGSTSSRKSGRSLNSIESTSPGSENTALPPIDSVTHPESHRDTVSSQTDSNGTATPTFKDSNGRANATGQSPSSSTTLTFPPLPAAPDVTEIPDAVDWKARKAKRQSHLAGLSFDQQKRISRALQEINSKLGQEQQIAHGPVTGDEEEVLEAEEEDEDDDAANDETIPGICRPSRTESEGSFQSQHSAPFPFGISPLKPDNAAPATVEPPSPSRLPPSPRSHNLKAHVEGPAEAIPPLSLARMLVARPQLPEPILTPSKQQPAMHAPSPSTSSPSAVSPVPGYIPGQPRPVGSMHRSDGSVSSRSATPTNHSPADFQAGNNQAYLKGHLRAGSTPTHPPPVTSRTSSLGRSRSVNQTTEHRLDEDSPLRQLASQARQNGSMLGDQGSSLSRRPSSNVSSSSPAMIQEESEGEDEIDTGERQQTPDIRLVEHRREVNQYAQDPQQHMDQARDALGWNLQRNRKGDNRIVSHQASFENGDSQHPLVSLSDYYRSDSESVVSDTSDFAGDDEIEITLDGLLGSHPSSSEGEVVQTPPVALDPTLSSNTLRTLTGLGQDDLVALQNSLVAKAIEERQAFRDESPVVPYSPALATDTLPTRSASLARGRSPMPPRNDSPQLPPSSWRRPSAGEQDRPGPPTHPTPPKSLVGLFTPPPAIELAGAGAERSGSASSRRNLAAMPEPPLTSTQTPSAEGHDEMIYTPQSDELGQKPSNIREGKVALENDPEVRRDFEARIAAATAALNKTPTSGAKLDRKPTKKGQMIISSPKLLSSSTNVAGTPLAPSETSPDASTKKALEKASGSTRKTSGRWRKLGFRRGPSLSSQTAEPLPPATQQLPPATPPQVQIAPPLGATPMTEKKLEEAINLPKGSTISPDLNNFKFPPIGNRQPRNPAIRDRPISPPMPYQPTMQQVAERIPGSSSSQIAPSRQDSFNADSLTENDPTLQKQAGNHSHSSSSESAVAKFIESGRALGLNNEQLDHMLLASGMLDRSATTASSRSYQSTAPTTDSLPHEGHSRTASQSQSQPSAQVLPPAQPQAPAQVAAASAPTKPQEKSKGGIFRSLSKSVKRTKSDAKAAARSPAVAPTVPEPRNVVVRRTLLLPHPPPAATPSGPTTPTMSRTAAPTLDSPDSARGFPGRKQSIRRKPLNLTREDVELVSNSPPPSHRRNFSTGTVHSNRSMDGTIEPLPTNKGLGFLHPLGHAGRSVSGGSASMLKMHESPGAKSTGSKRRSSTGGSLYDLYGDESMGQEEILRPGPLTAGDHASAASAASSSQAVEIREYADGQVVWSLVNGMRGDEQDMEDDEQDYSFSSHSRGDSFASNTSSGQVSAAPGWPSRNGSYTTPALNLRHRERGPESAPPARPETFVYRAASSDVADLIDHLSRDLDASRGRIDIRHLGHSGSIDHTSRSSPFQYSADQSRNGGDETVQHSPDPRIADPPSPNPPRSQSISRPSIPPPIFAPGRTAQVPAGGFSPKRQMMVRQGFAAHRATLSQGGGQPPVPAGEPSPSGLSFESTDTNGGQRSVEERLQHLLDRMKEQNDRQEAQILHQRSNRI